MYGLNQRWCFMIEWSEKLYYSEEIKNKKINKIKKAVNDGKLLFEIYCITFASNEKNLFDIMNVNELLFPYYQRKNIKILGLAASKEAAVLLVVDMIMEVYREKDDFNVRTYFS